MGRMKSSVGRCGQVLLAMLTAACDATVVGPTADATSDATVDATGAEDGARTEGGTGAESAGCGASGGASDCVMGCTGDVARSRVCADGRWVCPPGAMPMSACVPSCTGPGPVCCDLRTGETTAATCRGPEAWSCFPGTTPQPPGTRCEGRDGG